MEKRKLPVRIASELFEFPTHMKVQCGAQHANVCSKLLEVIAW
jgi:hypothetical protein